MKRLKAFIRKRISPHELSPDDGMRYWQERFVLLLVFASTVLGFIVYLPSVFLCIKEGLWSVVVADTLVYAWIAILFVRISLPFRIRAVSVSFVTYILGVIILLTIGPFGGEPGIVWLFAFPVLVALLLGLRISLVALAINGCTMVLIGILVHSNPMQWDYINPDSVHKWVVTALNFMLLNVIVTVTVAMIFEGLQNLLKRQKSMLADVEESEERFRILFESAPDAYYITDLDGNLIDGNRAAQELIGYSREDFLGKNFLVAGVLPPDQVPKAAALMQTNLKGRLAGPEEIVLKKKGGGTVVTEVIAIPTKIKHQHVVLGIARNISERKRLETELQKAQKMEAVGTLAGGVAHDLNNVLAGLVSYPERVLINMPEDSPYRKHILKIQKSGEKAAAIVQDLLTLARRGGVVKEVVNLNEVILEYLNSREYEHLKSLHPQVHVKTRLEKESPTYWVLPRTSLRAL